MTYLAQVSYTGDGSTTQYSITFPFIDSTHINVFIGGTQTTAFTISSSTLTFNTAPANSAVIRIERQTPTDARIVDFTDGSVLTESDLDKSADQNFYIAQEISDANQATLSLDTDDKFDAKSKVIKNLANPVNANDAVNKTYLENTWLSSANKTALTTVNANIANINAVNANETNINAAVNNATNINAAPSFATAAANSATASATSATNAANSFDSFDDRFLGTKASNPTVDNDGNALVEGAMYYNSTDNDIRFYNGSTWDAPATDAETSATNSANSATASATSATNAATSETNAETAKTNAETAETNAASSASAASTSASNASTSESNAASSASTASTQATNAATSATNAATSETNSASSATSASGSASTATTKASEASTSASNASTSASNAASSATAASNAQTSVENIFDNFDDRFLGTKTSDPTVDNDGNALSVGAVYYNSVANEIKFYNGSSWDAPSTSAATSATNASNSATAAATSAANAATSATNASTSETNAASSETSATSSASTATTKASEASTSATNAASSASTASTQATNASNSASAASTSESNASSSASSALSSKNAAEAALDTFDDAFLGAKSSDPSVDNDGDALIDGALYFDSTNNLLKVYDLGNTQWNRTTPTSSDQTKINTVSGIASDVTDVANIAVDVTTTANNVAGINSFAERYRVASSDPTTSLDAGDLAFNTSGNVLKYYDGSSWEAITAGGITELVQDSSPQLGGNLDLNSSNITGTGAIDITGNIEAGNFKQEGTNFTNSLIVGHSTTGTLNSATANTGVGIAALESITSGDNNTAVGSQALENLTTGLRNTAIGFFAQNANSTGQHNVSVGHASLASVVGGVRNTAFGYAAGNKTTANYNTFIGYGSGLNTVSGAYNTNLGWTSGDNITSGSGNVIIGSNIDAASATGNRQLAIGGYDGSTTTTWIRGDSSGNLTMPAEIAAVSLDISGDVDVDGTLETDALSIASTAVTSTAAELNILDGVTSTAAELNILDAVSRGSIIYGNSSAATDILTKGSAGTVLTSDGTDISWQAASSGGGTPAAGDLSTGSRNVALAATALDAIQSGATDNTGIGYNSLTAVTTGDENTAIGSCAGCSITTGSQNVAIGFTAGKGMSVGRGNIAIGMDTMANTIPYELNGNNVSIGNFAGHCITSGEGHVMIGHHAGCLQTTGNSNVFIGVEAGRKTTTAINSIAIGKEALLDNTTGTNLAIGNSALANVTTGNANTAIGNQALYTQNTNINNNTAIGYQAGCAITTGSENVLIGNETGKNLTTGTNNIIIGREATSSAAGVNHEITLGNSSISTIRSQVTSITALSDRRDKTNIKDLNVGLDFINDLKPVTFDWDARDGSKKGKKEVGFIAQDLDEVQQKYNIEENLQIVLKSNPDKLEATQGKLIPILVQAIKDLKKEIDELKKS